MLSQQLPKKLQEKKVNKARVMGRTEIAERQLCPF
jgi:hypothetical protein